MTRQTQHRFAATLALLICSLELTGCNENNRPAPTANQAEPKQASAAKATEKASDEKQLAALLDQVEFTDVVNVSMENSLGREYWATGDIGFDKKWEKPWNEFRTILGDYLREFDVVKTGAYITPAVVKVRLRFIEFRIEVFLQLHEDDDGYDNIIPALAKALNKDQEMPVTVGDRKSQVRIRGPEK